MTPMREYLHYDVFTNRAFEGNQLAVFTDAKGLSSEQMQTMTREMNFSESTFLLPAETPGTDLRMRIFTPGAELPMAGHPTIGSTFALADSGAISVGTEQFVFGLGIGPTTVELTWSGSRLEFAWMDQKAPEVRTPASPVADILQSIGCVTSMLDSRGLPVEEVSCGVPFIYVPLSSRAAVDAAEPNLRAMRALRSAFPGGHNAVLLFALEPYGSEVTVYSRVFAPGLGVAEDPATGGASGPLGCYLVTHRLVDASVWHDMVSLQGVKMGRPSRIHMRITASSSETITRVQVGGQAVRVGSGTLASE
jgi:trans-2,3-dihydro-3-hydroxyanthranilate isomerase